MQLIWCRFILSGYITGNLCLISACFSRKLRNFCGVNLVGSFVPSTEANSLENKISNESPVGAALIGAHVGEIVTAQTPGGARRLKVIEIAL